MVTWLSSSTGALFIGINGGNKIGSTDLTDDTWHHIACVFPDGSTNANQHVLYVDGSVETTGSSVSHSVNTSLNTGARMGYSNVTGTNAATGIVDNARFYDRELTASEILEFYNTGT